jgi:hypothetical protein
VIHWEVTASGVRAAGPDGEILVRSPDWQPTDASPSLGRPVDATATGVTTQVSLPTPEATLAPADRTAQPQRAARRADPVTTDDSSAGPPGGSPGLKAPGVLPADCEYVLEADTGLAVAARFEGPAEVTRGDETTVSFEAPTPVTLGFRSAERVPTDSITIPKTLDGVATAITHAASAHHAMTPERSRRSMRRHPPTFEFGDGVDVPEEIRAETPETGIEVLVPRSLRSLFVVAPLAYYLGADVRVDAGVTPTLRAPDAGVADTFDNLVDEVPDLLARVFWLDCLTRSPSDPAAPRPVEEGTLPELGLDPGAALDATPAERLRTYLDAPFERVADQFPEWHLSMHVAPNLDHVGTLPFLLDRLATIYPPETAALESQALLERSLDDFYRGAPGPVASVEMLEPKRREGRAQGWLAEGTPIDVFKTTPAAYENHLDYVRRPADELSVAVVLNDESMAGEHESVADVYRSRAESLPMEVSLHENLTGEELAAVFREHHAFVHYIGHCEVSGLRCADGNLAVSDLGETNVETFFLNACGSYYEGLDLVNRGSVAGAVTFRKVLDEQAAKVGTAFARLLVHGFPIETALRLARRRILMGKDYAVVGDGMQTLSHTNADDAHVAHVTRLASGDCRVSWAQHAVNAHGEQYDLDVEVAGPPRLAGNETTFTMAPAELASFLEDGDHPVIVDGEFYWTDEAVAMLRGHQPN